MAPEFSYEQRTVNDKSALSEGWKPAFLLAISEEDTPAQWQMAKQSPRMWRWHFSVWEVPTLIDRQSPEHQTAPSSKTFSPGGKYQPSKAYLWTKELLGRDIQPGERVSLDPLMPIPCRVKIRRKDDYANIVDLERWPEGTALLTDDCRANLLLWWQQVQAGAHSAPEDTPAPAPASAPPQPWMTQTPPAPPSPGLQSWGTQHGQPAPAPVTTGRTAW